MKALFFTDNMHVSQRGLYLRVVMITKFISKILSSSIKTKKSIQKGFILLYE